MVYLTVTFIGHNGSMQELLSLAQRAERLNIDNINFPDDIWNRDVFVTQSVILKKTDHINLTTITNPYSRHPVLIARAAASLIELGPRRIRICFCAGGSFTLKPLNIPMWQKP
ncbi:unnamed protein product, partial [marine sediment metagenome]